MFCLGGSKEEREGGREGTTDLDEAVIEAEVVTNAVLPSLSVVPETS